MLLNVKKTKELIIDFRIKKEPLQPLVIKDEPIDIVNSYKYLGITIDDKLDWHSHASLVYSKMCQRMYLLRKLNSFHIDKTILSLFYRSTIESVLLFCICGWGGNCTIKDQKHFNSVINKASRICSNSFEHTSDTLQKISFKKVTHIMKHKSHPLFSQIKTSQRSGRVTLMNCRKERYKRSFLPASLKLYLDKNFKR